MNKFRNVKTIIDNITFDSKAEARRYQELMLLVRAKKIRGLSLQPKWNLTVNGIKIGTYAADFSYYDTEYGVFHVEDKKGVATQMFKLKQKLMRAIHGIDVEVV